MKRMFSKAQKGTGGQNTSAIDEKITLDLSKRTRDQEKEELVLHS